MGRAEWSDLARLIDPVETLWLDGIHTFNGLNDKIPLDQAVTIQSSLRLLHVKNLILSVFKPSEAFGDPKHRVQGCFRYGMNEYRLWVTDPRYARAYLAKPDGRYEVGEAFLTVSLGEPHKTPATSSSLPSFRSCYENGRVQYTRLARTKLFQSGLDRVRRGTYNHRIALMCAEKEPLECHRTLLVARALVELGTTMVHILADGGIETYDDAMARLLSAVGLPHEDFFRSKQELLAQAMALQEERIAHLNERITGTAMGDA